MQITIVELTRKQLYDDIWEMSAAGTAKKYGISYAQFLKQVKGANIPIPPSGYWTKLSFGKPVEKIELGGAPDEVISFSAECLAHKESVSGQREVLSQPANSLGQAAEERYPMEQTQILQPIDETQLQDVVQEPETIQQWGRTYNIYDRETLYKEVWTSPVTEVAKKYKVSDVAIHKVCRSLDIPTPPQGYWAKRKAGKSVVQIPLPKSDKKQKKTGVQTGISAKTETGQPVLDFLEDEERTVIMAVASQILLPGEEERMHPKIVVHRKVIAAWKKENSDYSNRWRPNHIPPPPFLATEIASESIPRACRIIDALIKAMEPLGCKLTDQLSFVVNGETVAISFSEAKDKVKHIPTKEENLQLLEYEDCRRRHTYAAKPKIREYDYQFNGRMGFTINEKRTLRDCKSYQLEDRLGDMMPELYAAAEAIKQQRLAKEEAERKRQEEQRKREERRRRYNEEVDRTLALVHESEDYDIACKIRRYIEAYKAAHPDENITEWLEWAKAKADWYDPTVSCNDEFLGERKHGESTETKMLKHMGYW